MIDLNVTKNEWDGKFDVRFRVTREQLDALRTVASDFLEEVTLGVREQYKEDHACDVVDMSDGPCGDPSHDELKSSLTVLKDKCPDCKYGYQIERINSKTGYTFMGCDEFPKCKFSKPGGSKPAPVSKEPYCGCFDDVPYDYEDEVNSFDNWGYGSQEDFF